MTQPQDLPASAVTDLGDIPLGDPLEVAGDDYARIMRRIGLSDGKPGTTVSAFNSSV